MTWLDVFERIMHEISQLGPTIGLIVSSWFGLLAGRSGNLNKQQFKELKDELGAIQHAVEIVQEVGEDNNKKINGVNEKLEVHDEAHLVTMYLRLERDITVAINRGYTTVHESDIVHRMHDNYKKLGGNGRIDSLFAKYNYLEVRN
jgi:hypothetical protein